MPGGEPASGAVEEARARLTGRAPGPSSQGLDILERASTGGDAQASILLAALNAAGAWTRQDWPRALSLLERASTQGSGSAAAQLDLLTENAGLTRINDAPERRKLCEAPRVRTCTGIISPAQCDWLTGQARGRLERAAVIDAMSAEQHSSARTNRAALFEVFDQDCVMAFARQRMALALNLPVSAMENPQVLHYAVGQEFLPHVDYLARPGDAAPAGERIATFLIYLSEDFDAGETWFVRADLKVKPAKGDAVFFANVTPDGAPDPQSLHAGLAPTRGEKWVLSQWVRDRSFGT